MELLLMKYSSASRFPGKNTDEEKKKFLHIGGHWEAYG